MLSPSGTTADPRPLARTLDREGLEAALRGALPPGAARACASWLELRLYQGGALTFEGLGPAGRVWPEAIGKTLRVEPLLEERDRSSCAEDGSVRVVLGIRRLGGSEAVETVAIPRRDDLVVCISSQAGCALGCTFCATGLLGFRGNLTAAEMVEQHAWAQQAAGRRVTDAVFMGMGEPFLNYDAVIEAAHALHRPRGAQISPRKIVISTAGVIPAIHRYVRERHPFQLFFSITSAIPEKRRRLMPLEAAHPLPELVDAIREYQRSLRRNRWATLEYVAIPGETMGDEDVDALGRAFAGIPFIVDVIPCNTTDGRFRAPSWEEVARFTTALRRLGMPVKVRYSSGKKHGGGCGQLAAGLVEAAEPQGHLLAPAGVFSDLQRPADGAAEAAPR
jgi:23S rRNA (adenine2503-C2)-methyltransferase